MSSPHIVGNLHGYRFRREVRRMAIVDGVVVSALGVWAAIDMLLEERRRRRANR